MSETLTADQIKIIQKWIGDKRLDPKCPTCGHDNTLTIQEHLIAPPLYSEGGISIGGPTYPSFIMICSNCGLTQIYNALKAGVVK